MTNEIKVGDSGFVRYVDHMGGDEAIVQAARISYGKGTKSVSADEQLIRYLMRNQHTSPLEMAEIKLHIRMPLYVYVQFGRHRTASINMYSQRYSEAIEAMEGTTIWRSQSTQNKQGSGETLSEEACLELSNEEKELHQTLERVYKKRLEMGVAREQARKDLPLSNYTELYWKIDLNNLFKFLKLRLDYHAQQEIREFAVAIHDIAKQYFPIAFKAFHDYEIDSVKLTAGELRVLKSLIGPLDSIRLWEAIQLWGDPMSKSELNEFKHKLGLGD